MWEKVVLNLLSNALKFTFDGSISVTLRAEDSGAVLRISDTGSGIAADEMPRLFERFHRIPSTRSRSNEGSGIGLALVRELVGLHGGSITAGSTEGAGTTFTVRLPFGHGHLPEKDLAAAGPETISAAADPFLAEAYRWLPGDHPGQPPLAAGPLAAAPAPVPRSWNWPGGVRPPGCCSPTTTRICASTCNGCWRAATRSPRWRTGRRRWTRPGRIRSTW